MKRFLSILLSVLMVMSTMSVVALAESTYTLTTVATTQKSAIDSSDFIKKDSLVRLKVSGIADGNTIKYYNNGVEITNVIAETDAAGNATGIVRVPADGFVNNFTAKVFDDATEIGATNSVMVKTETYEETPFNTVAPNDTETASKADITQDDSLAANYALWSDLDDITIEGKAAKKLTKTVDGATTSATVATADLGLMNDIQVSSYSFYVDSNVARTENLYLMGMKWRARAQPAWGYTLCGSNPWSTGIVVLNTDNTITINDPVAASPVNYTVSEDEWHSLSVVTNMADRVNGSPTFDIYIDNVCLVSDTPLRTLQCTKCAEAHTNCYFNEVTTNFYVGKLAGIYIADAMLETFAISSASISIENINGNIFSDKKIKITPANLEAGMSVAAVKDGVVTVLSADANGDYTVVAGDGFHTVKGIIVDGYNNILTETVELSYYGISNTPSDTFLVNATWDNESEYEEGVFAVGNVGLGAIYDDYKKDYGAIVETEENGNKYIKLSNWNKAAAKPSATAADTCATTNIAVGYASQSSATVKPIVFEVDYRFESYWRVDDSGETPQLVTTKIDSFDDMKAAFNDALHSNAAVLRVDRYLMNLNMYTTDPFKSGSSYRKGFGVFGADKTTGKVKARVYQDGVIEETLLDINPGEWHNYKAIADISTNSVWLYVDGELVASGELADVPVYGFYYNSISAITAQENYSGIGGITVNIDDIKMYETTIASAPTTPYIDATAEGIVFMPGNMTEKPENLAVIAVNGDNYEIQTWNAAAATETYKPFTFKNLAEKIFVWNWENLKPIVEAITIGQ